MIYISLFILIWAAMLYLINQVGLITAPVMGVSALLSAVLALIAGRAIRRREGYTPEPKNVPLRIAKRTPARWTVPPHGVKVRRASPQNVMEISALVEQRSTGRWLGSPLAFWVDLPLLGSCFEVRNAILGMLENDRGAKSDVYPVPVRGVQLADVTDYDRRHQKPLSYREYDEQERVR